MYIKFQLLLTFRAIAQLFVKLCCTLLQTILVIFEH